MQSSSDPITIVVMTLFCLRGGYCVCRISAIVYSCSLEKKQNSYTGHRDIATMHTAVSVVSIRGHAFRPSTEAYGFGATVISKLIIYVPLSASSLSVVALIVASAWTMSAESWANFDTLGTADRAGLAHLSCCHLRVRMRRSGHHLSNGSL